MSARTRLSVVFLLLALAGQTVFSMRLKSPTCDEFAHHIANGYSYLLTHDFRMNPASPPLSRMWPALPLYFLGAKLPLDHESWRKGDTVEFAKQFFYHTNGDCTDRFVFWARVPVVILSVFFGLAVFLFSRKIFGDAGGLISLLLYSFSPNIIAHSGLATADLMVAFFFFLSLTSFRSYLNQSNAMKLVLTGVMTGLAFLSKFSAVLLPPILLLIGIFSGQRKLISIPRTVSFLAVAALTIWAGYFFEIKPLLRNTPDPPKKIEFIQKVGGPALVEVAQKMPIPLATFFSSIASMAFTRQKGCAAYFMGEWSAHGWWQYYYVAFLIKETITVILLFLASLFLLRRLKLDRITQWTLLLPIGFFFLVTMPDKAQAGIRYFLPIFPLIFVLAGGTAIYLWKQTKALKFVVIGLLSWHVAAAVVIYPDHLAYFNEFVGGPSRGYKYLRDSNIDWCQDLKGVGAWAQKKGYSEVVVLYHGVEDPLYYKIPYRLFRPEEFHAPSKTVYAIGAHRLDTVDWTKSLQPTHVVGHSFFIYDLRDDREQQQP